MADIAGYQSIFTGIEIDQVISRCRTGKNLENLGQLDNYIEMIKSSNSAIAPLNERVNNIEDTINNHLFSTYGGNIKKTKDSAGNLIKGQILQDRKDVDGLHANAKYNALVRFLEVPENYSPLFSGTINGGDISMGLQKDGKFIWQFTSLNGETKELASITPQGQVFGAVWNDYAEFRKSEEMEPGRVVCENGDGTLSLSQKRLQPGANVISDTYGFSIGQTAYAQTPIAVAGRVLAYTFEDWWTFEPGEPVCAGPNGTVSKMSRKEVRKYPDRIIGTVSELPTYEYWGNNHIKVNNRIWIKLK